MIFKLKLIKILDEAYRNAHANNKPTQSGQSVRYLRHHMSDPEKAQTKTMAQLQKCYIDL